ncbi:MAG: hypothetical protein KAQ85_10585, partial [Thermodesulfovibrionia bacterium]|nr:hypothetical protein [Thermodesulfovibrionia bacterium]
LVGNFRYRLYYSKWSNLLLSHIRDQIDFRIKHMNPRCFVEGSCEICGCKTTALQMCNKACDNPCYPTMMNRKDWKSFKKGGLYYDREIKMFWKLRDEKLIKFKDYKDYVGNISC